MSAVEADRSLLTGQNAEIVTVRRAVAANAASSWALNQGAYLAFAPVRHDEAAINELPVLTAFAGTRTDLVGRESREWQDMIRDESGNQAVFNAWIQGAETPAGVVRPFIDGDTRWIGNLRIGNHVADRIWSDVFGSLLAAAQEWHDYDGTRILVPSRDRRMQDMLGQVGFRVTGQCREGIIDELEMAKQGRH